MLPDQPDRATPEVEEGGIPDTEGQATLSDTEGLRRSQRTRRPPGYLGEYYCGQVGEGYPSPSGVETPHHNYPSPNHATGGARQQGRTSSMYYTKR